MKIRIKVKKPSVNRACVFVLLFLYIIVLLWLIVFKCNINSQLHVDRNLSKTLWERFTYRIVPFQELYIIIFKGSSTLNTLAFFLNTVCCIPGGMILGFIMNKRWGVFFSGIFILGVELFQLFSGIGGFDPTDLFMNLLGVYIGYLICDVIKKRVPVRVINGFFITFVCIAIPVAAFAVARTVMNFPI